MLEYYCFYDMVIFPLQVQAEKKEADTDLDRTTEVDFDTEREEMLGYPDEGKSFFRSGRIFRTGNGNELLGAGGEYLKAGSVWKALQGSEAISKRHWWENLRKIRKA